jgi:hypothetical protein
MEENAKRKKNYIFFGVNYLLLFKTFFAGALIGEVFLLTEEIVKIFSSLSTLNQKDSWLWLFGIAYTLMIVCCFFSKGLGRKIWFVIKSLRLDLLINLSAGMYLIFAYGGIGINSFNNLLKSLSWLQLTVLISFPVIVFISLISRKLQTGFNTGKNQDAKNSLIMSDKEGETKSNDELNYSGKAEIFAERVFNQGSSESLVFAIDAPWGMGKTTFVNFCKEYWTNNYGNEIIVYTLDLIQYDNEDNLSEKLIDGFINGIIQEISNYGYYPELQPLALKYSKLLKGKKTKFSIDDVYQRLEESLQNFDKKIIIIIDDLDRLNFSAIKEVLFTIKKAFLFPNISYVLCYDTENIAALEQRNVDIETITEFLEKFINIKIGLYLDNKKLLQYFIENIKKSLKNNPLIDPELLSKVTKGLKDIFKSPNFHYYLPLLGNPRKLKRLINTILLIDTEKTDFENFDFDSQDLIHLLLIYINYPDIFREIYSMETQGKRGFFSAVPNYQEENKFKNSVEYNNYLKSLSENQKYILNKVFNITQRLKDSGRDVLNLENITREMYMSYACLNGSARSLGGGNLEKYLNLITSISRPLTAEQHRFFIDSKNRILLNGTITKEFTNEKYSFSKSESSHKQLWRALVNTIPDEFSGEKSKEVIYYALNNLPQYSLIEIADIGVGLRKYLTFYIVKLLDQVGWSDGEGKHRNNIDDNSIEIARWIFGEGDHREEGILDILGKEDRGVMGLYDLLLFRLSCCANRGRDIPNLSRALSKHGNLHVSSSGNIGITVVEKMRLISQKVFQGFQSQFINQNKNIFDEIDNLTLKDICGKYFNSIAKSGAIEDIEVQLLKLKSIMKSFIVYQLGNTTIGQGIGCGYYNPNGNRDEKENNLTINNYLFEYCFNPQKQGKNYKHFLDYLLLNFVPFINYSNANYINNIKEFTKVLDKDLLAAYWDKHCDFIKNKNYQSEDRKVFTGKDVIIAYNENLVNVYEVLDELINKDKLD